MRKITRSAFILASATALSGTLFATTAPAPAQAMPVTRVVGLGDSFASGVGTSSYDANTNSSSDQCWRSSYSWQRRLSVGYQSLAQFACKGATTTNMMAGLPSVSGRGPHYAGEPNYQMDKLNGSENYVLLSIGGNDLNFSGTIETCVLPYTVTTCSNAVDASVKKLPATLNNVSRIIKAIHSKSPRARIILAGYPALANSPIQRLSCGLRYIKLTGPNDDKAKAIFRGGAAVNSAYKSTVGNLQRQGLPVRYVDTFTTFANNRLDACGSHAQINGPSLNWLNRKFTVDNSFHPSKAGYDTYTRLVNAAR